MTRLFTLVLLAGICTFVSCKKTAVMSGGSWTVNSTSYTASTCNGNSGIQAITSDGTMLRVIFSSNPTTSGTYNVVSYWGSFPVSGQVCIWSSTSSTFLYGSTGGGMVSVSVSNGTITVSGAGIPMAQASGYAAGNSVGPLTFSEYY